MDSWGFFYILFLVKLPSYNVLHVCWLFILFEGSTTPNLYRHKTNTPHHPKHIPSVKHGDSSIMLRGFSSRGTVEVLELNSYTKRL